MTNFDTLMSNLAKWENMDNTYQGRTPDFYGFQIAEIKSPDGTKVAYLTVNTSSEMCVDEHDNFPAARDALIERLRDLNEMGLL